MLDRKRDASSPNPLARAMSRRSEHHATTDEERQQLAEELMEGEEEILFCLGAAAIKAWEKLPRDIQREMFNDAVSAERSSSAERRDALARFLHFYAN
jgi:hypothetical protein